MKTRTRLVAVVFAGLTSVISSAAHAETPADRNLARKLAGEALDLFKAGDNAAALAKFREADALVPAPTLKVRMAKCLDRLGRMHEAAERYREVIALELKPWSPRVHREARDEAVESLARLLEETPKLTVMLAPTTDARAVVTVDGKAMAGPVGQPLSLDPGQHSLVLTSGALKSERTVTLERGRSERVVLELPRPVVNPVAVPVSGKWRTPGYVLVGAGGAGLVVGVVSTVLLYRDRGKLDELCPGGPCFADQQEAVTVAERYNRERIASTVGFVAGGVLGAAGASLLILDAVGSEQKDKGASVVPIVGPGFLGLSGRF